MGSTKYSCPVAAAARSSLILTLQVLLPPQPFDLRHWHTALQKLPAVLSGISGDSTKTGALALETNATTVQSEQLLKPFGHRAAFAVRSLVEYMATNEAVVSCSSKTLTIFGQAFQHVDAYASVLQVQHTSVCIVRWDTYIVLVEQEADKQSTHCPGRVHLHLHGKHIVTVACLHLMCCDNDVCAVCSRKGHSGKLCSHGSQPG